MKYLLLILILINCKQVSEKPELQNIPVSFDSTKVVSVKGENNKTRIIPVKNLADAIEYSKDSYLVDDMAYIPKLDIISIIDYLEIPDSNVFLKNSIENFSQKYNGALFFKFDFSNDGNEDIIYISNYGAEEMHTVLWIKEKDKYKFVTMIWGKLKKLFRHKNKSPYSLLVVSGFCCASWIGDYTIYKPLITNNKLTYKKQTNYKVFDSLEPPKFIHPPISFTTLDKNCILRSSPSIVNPPDTIISEDPDQEIYGNDGNILAEFKIGSKGIAISSQHDTTSTWWFVIMDTSSQTIKNYFYADKNSHKVGWMRSKYLNIDTTVYNKSLNGNLPRER